MTMLKRKELVHIVTIDEKQIVCNNRNAKLKTFLYGDHYSFSNIVKLERQKSIVSK